MRAACFFPRLIASLRSSDHDISNIAVFPTGLPDRQVSTNDSIKFLVGGWLHSIDSSSINRGHPLPFFRYVPLAPFAIGKRRKETARIASFLSFGFVFQFPIGENRSHRSARQLLNLKNPITLNRFRNGPSHGPTPFLFLILCYR